MLTMAGGVLAGDNADKPLLVERTQFIGNFSDGIAGGLRVSSPLLLKDSLVADNEAEILAGGMVAAYAQVRSSTLARNRAPQLGGALLGSGLSGGPPMELVQVTVSGNESSFAGYGAGLFLQYHTKIWNSTITGNTEHAAAPIGAGVTLGDNTELLLKSSIVSGNRYHSLGSPVSAASDLGFVGTQGSLAQGDYNLLGEVINFLPTDFEHSYEGIENPQLEPLANNGGPTWTHLPSTLSLAYNRGAQNTLDYDQRGPGYPRVVAWQADIGPSSATTTASSSMVSITGSFRCRASSCVNPSRCSLAAGRWSVPGLARGRCCARQCPRAATPWTRPPDGHGFTYADAQS